MTFEEYTKQISRLSGEYPSHFSSKGRIQLLFEKVKDLDDSWFRKLVDRIILSNDPRFNFDEAARGERIARQKVRDTEALFKMEDQLHAKITENGLSDVLQKLGAKSLLDAINKK